MNEELLKNIQDAGHWRINLRPLSVLAEELSMAKCRDAVSESNVELRGWDYPHVLLRNDASSGCSNGDGFFEAWTSWNTHVEFWRMYRSGQFLHYRAMWEDLEEFEGMPQRPFLSIEGAIFLFTEIAEFASRLANRLGLTDGLSLSVEARHTKGRRLWVGPGRMSFFEPKTTTAEQIEIRTTVPADGSRSAQQVSMEMCKVFFDRFGWNPSDDQIQRDQTRLYKRQF